MAAFYELPKQINPARLEWHDHVERCLQTHSPRAN